MIQIISYAIILLWGVSLLSIFFSYILYPVLLISVSKFFCSKSKTLQGKKIVQNSLPYVSVLVVGKNEEKNIVKKLENLVKLDYPTNKMEIIVISDGSTDNMVKKAEKFASQKPEVKIKILALKNNVGVNEAFAQGVSLAEGNIILFTDSNSFLESKALKLLVHALKKKDVGLANGYIVFIPSDEEHLENKAVLEGYRSYWNLEKLIKKAESKCNTSCIITGAISAIKKELFLPLKSEYSSDMILPLWVASKRLKTEFVEDAILYSPQRRDEKSDFKRRTRVILRGFYTFLYMLKTIPVTVSNFKNYIALFFHKVLRWLSLSFLGLSLIFSLATSPLLWVSKIVALKILCFIGLIFISLQAISYLFYSKLRIKKKLVNIFFYSSLLVYSAVLALLLLLKGKKVRTWVPDKG